MSICTQCGRPAAVTYGAICLCAEHYGIWVAENNVSALGAVYDRGRQTFRMPTAEEKARQEAVRASLAGPLAPSSGQGDGLRRFNPQTPQRVAESVTALGGMTRNMHPDEAERLRNVAQSVPGGSL